MIKCLSCGYTANSTWNLPCASCRVNNCGGYVITPGGTAVTSMKVEISKEKFMSLVDSAIEKAEEKYKKNMSEAKDKLQEFNELVIERYKDILSSYSKTGVVDIAPTSKAWVYPQNNSKDGMAIVGFAGTKTAIIYKTKNYADELKTMKAMLSLGCCDKVTITPQLIEFFS